MKRAYQPPRVLGRVPWILYAAIYPFMRPLDCDREQTPYEKQRWVPNEMIFRAFTLGCGLDV